MTTLPFLARHDDAAMSTVFGFANRRYASLIRASESRLSRMAAEWLKRPLACDKRPPPHCGGPPLTTRRRCILHIGTMKTGTTTVQAWLKQNAGWLAEQGWTYPGWPLRHAGLIGQAIQTLPADGNLVISDEGLWHYSGSARSDTAAIAKALEDFDVTVIVYFRRPDHFLESWFKQGTKNGTGQVDISAFLSGFATSSTTFRNRLNRFATLFGDDRLIVAPYERAQMQQGDILADFLHRTGLPQPPADLGAKEKLRENVSPGSDTILLAGLMRQVFGLDQDRIDQILTLVPVENIARARHSLFTREEVAAIRADYRPVFAEIQQRFGSGAAPDFFLDWGDDDDLPPVSPLRLAYDGYLAHPAEPDSTAAE
ncbi:hypothetical protein GB880_011050 [Paracoccus sp. SMMA_5_TC]|uniref:hypothetical protein n=1 Tax=Paracoccus sp. SMMA_5_TC TaxID=2654280 RepID=UPI0021E14E7A|nr:hypothetical protein [Paracoccus sp. SMMA_5_TC]UXU80328.1 hypothetical protein GB880_011050 [Paracoccus sp. SMMA_5_TC]